MDLRSTDLLGIFTCSFYPEDYEYKDCYIHSNDIFIYRDTFQRLSFNRLLAREDGQNWFREFEEGFVHLDLAQHEIQFEARHYYYWNARGELGYDGDTYSHYKYDPKKTIEIFRPLNAIEIASAKQKGEIEEQTAIVIARQKENLLYERIESEEANASSYRESATQLEERIIETRTRLHEHWQDMIEPHLRAKIVQGILPSASAYVNRGKTYRSLGQYDQADADFTRAIQLEPEQDTAYYNRGLLYSHNLQQYEQAILDFDRVIQLQPDTMDTYFERGSTHVHLQHYQQAIADFEHVIASDPYVSMATPTYMNRGVAYLRSQAYQQAFLDFDKAIELDPEYTIAYNGRGCTHHFLERYQQAIDDYNQAIERDPTDALYYSNRGEAYQCLLQLDQAIADFELALAMKPDLPNTRGYLAKARQEQQESSTTNEKSA